MDIAKLNVNLAAPERVPSRDGYGLGLVDAGEDENVVALGADITASVRVDWFVKKFPDRFISIGIAEQNQMCIAAGLALMGKIPFVTNYGVFLAGRSWDQIRTTVCYNNLNVKMGGAHGGISVGQDGATHQALEEIALMRCLPNMTVLVPADAVEARKATVAAAKMYGPVYIRFGREKVPVITDASTPFEIGKAYCCRDGSDVAIVACGAMVFEALVAAEKLAEAGISAMVINNHSVKPIDKATLIEAAQKTGTVVTVEEHQVMGGMGSAVLEVLAQNCAVPVRMIGINDRFGESGDPETLMNAFGLTSGHIVEAAKAAIAAKQG
ncbi:MAG TPA: transketolase C-terminal domain-containing protein [Clostridia bacterium]